MPYKYCHNVKLKTVYRFPIQPQVKEKRDNKQNIIGWSVTMKIDITRADNVLEQHRWKYPTQSNPTDYFDNIGNRYDDRQIVIDFFHKHNDPEGIEIDEKTYLELKSEYEKESVGNK